MRADILSGDKSPSAEKNLDSTFVSFDPQTVEITLNGKNLSPEKVWEAARLALNPRGRLHITLARDAEKRIVAADRFVQNIVRGKKAVYGINTGFGKFAEVQIPNEQLALLQKNLIHSHCCGVGAPFGRDIVMAMWLIRLNTICRGNSGVRLDTVKLIIRALEAGFLADVPSKGSVGASGDLAPSAHAVSALLGVGTASWPDGGRFVSGTASDGLKNFSFTPLTLGPKEGLSLINGTQSTTALALKTYAEGTRLLHTANLAASLMIEGLRASHATVDMHILQSRNQAGAEKCGAEMREWLSGPSEIAKSHKNCDRVQDPYSIRCAAQVHGALADELAFAYQTLSREINSSTDNPLLFPEDKLSLSGGNFHAIYTARTSDILCGSLTVLASISERRICLAMKPESSQLPTFLIKEGGLNSGFMMAHVTSAALVSECKALSFPASVDSIPTNADKEDHVSMGPIAGLKAVTVCENVRHVLAIELLVAAQAIDLLSPLKPTKRLARVHSVIREHVSYLESDRVLNTDINRMAKLIHEGTLLTC